MAPALCAIWHTLEMMLFDLSILPLAINIVQAIPLKKVRGGETPPPEFDHLPQNRVCILDEKKRVFFFS